MITALTVLQNILETQLVACLLGAVCGAWIAFKAMKIMRGE